MSMLSYNWYFTTFTIYNLKLFFVIELATTDFLRKYFVFYFGTYVLGPLAHKSTFNVL